MILLEDIEIFKSVGFILGVHVSINSALLIEQQEIN
jgi:hypothetical protein